MTLSAKTLILFFMLFAAMPWLSAINNSRVYDNIFDLPANISLFTGDSVNLSLAYGVALTGITWTSTNNAVVAVNTRGIMEAKGKGMAKITARFDQFMVSAMVNVSNRFINLLPHSSTIRVTEDTLQLFPSGLHVSVDPFVTWESGNSTLVIVSNGRAIGLKTGRTWVVAKFKDGLETDTAFIEVIDNSTSLFEVTPSSLILNPGGEALLLFTSRIDGLASVPVLWSSDNPDVAVVDQLGYVTAINKGHTTINVSALGQEIDIPLDVFGEPEQAYHVYPSLAEIGEGEDLLFQVIPNHAEQTGGLSGDDQIQWFCSDTLVATVSETGLVSGKMPGFTKVTAVYRNTFQEAHLVVTGKMAHVRILPIPGELNIGEPVQLRLNNFEPGTNGQTVKWQSDNEAVAIVSDDGLVIGLRPGDTKIIAWLVSANQQNIGQLGLADMMEVTVNDPSEEIPVLEYTMNRGEWLHLTDAFPELTPDARLQMDTKNIIQVDNQFNVYALNNGFAIVRICDIAGALKTICKIVVKSDAEWHPGVKSVALRNLRTVVIEFNTDIYVLVGQLLKEKIKVEITSKELASKSSPILEVENAFFEDGTRTLVVELNRDINLFNGESIRLFANEGFMAMDDNVSFEVFIGDIKGATPIESINTSLLKIYPNPAAHTLNIESKIPLKSITVYTQQGKLVSFDEVIHSLSNVVKLSGLTSGLYFVKVEDVNGGNKTFKVLKP